MRHIRARPKPIAPGRIRRIRGSFSCIEHRFINARLIDLMQTEEILLYFFLTTVGNVAGISFYSSERMAGILKISIPVIEKSRQSLIEKGFIVYNKGVYQVLDLPNI